YLAPSKLATLATNAYAVTSRVGTLAAIVTEYPRVEELEEAVRVGTSEAINAYLDRARRSLQRCRARQTSRIALDSLSPYFDEGWISARSAEIDADQSTASVLSAIASALNSLSYYQEFRIRSQGLGPLEWSLFRILRTKEPLLLSIPKEN